ncbi:serine hydrolase domain-containing protein [Leifsonia aquatica]|uniref:serine hydrolase domain-containing protein n=1 Tax=Leifsonia aquatica TaxID=144185 RepID=UPI003851731D
MRLRRQHRVRLLLAAAATALMLAGCTADPVPAASPTASTAAAGGCAGASSSGSGLCVADGAQARDAAALIDSSFSDGKLGALIVGVWKAGEPVVTGALGQSQAGVPATVDMHHITGNITAAALTTIFLELVDRGELHLGDPLSTWFPDLPDARQVTLEMLARSSSGYAHYPNLDAFEKAFYADPFRQWTAAEIIPYGASEQPAFTPGTSWKFADINFIILAQVLEKATGRTMAALLDEYVLRPLGMNDTTPPIDGLLQGPVLHAYTSERGVWEESTYWNPSWTQYAGGMGSNQADLRKLIEAVGTGKLLSAASHRMQTEPDPDGIGVIDAHRAYTMGIAVVDGWLVANPSLQGYRAVVAYLPSEKVTIIAYSTATPQTDPDVPAPTLLFQKLAALLTPDDVPHVTG